MKHEEQDLERRCNAYARSNGWAAWKNEGNGNKGIPDGSFLHPCGAFVMVEFKTQHGRVRPEQKIWAQRFPNTVFFIRTFEEFTALLNTKIEEKILYRRTLEQLKELSVKEIEPIKK